MEKGPSSLAQAMAQAAGHPQALAAVFEAHSIRQKFALFFSEGNAEMHFDMIPKPCCWLRPEDVEGGATAMGFGLYETYNQGPKLAFIYANTAEPLREVRLVSTETAPHLLEILGLFSDALESDAWRQVPVGRRVCLTPAR